MITKVLPCLEYPMANTIDDSHTIQHVATGNYWLTAAAISFIIHLLFKQLCSTWICLES